jgi:hypothetical protein
MLFRAVYKPGSPAARPFRVARNNMQRDPSCEKDRLRRAFSHMLNHLEKLRSSFSR